MVAVDGGRERRTWAQLWQEALRVGAGLEQLGVSAGQRVLVMMPTGHEMLATFFGAMALGAHPLPLAPPRPDHPNALGSVRQLARFARRVEASIILYQESMPLEQRPGVGATSPFELSASFAELSERAGPGAALDVPSDPPEVAYLQATSGATGPVRAVPLTHANILSSVRAAGQALQIESGDVGVSWLPLDNIMSLVGFVFSVDLLGAGRGVDRSGAVSGASPRVAARHRSPRRHDHRRPQLRLPLLRAAGAGRVIWRGWICPRCVWR